MSSPIFCNFTSASNRPILLAAAPFVSQNAQDGTPHCSITCHVHHHRDLEIPRRSRDLVGELIEVNHQILKVSWCCLVVSCKSSISTGRKKSRKKKNEKQPAYETSLLMNSVSPLLNFLREFGGFSKNLN